MVNLNQIYSDRLRRLECRDATAKTSHPLVYEKAQGSTVTDVAEHTYTDLCAGFGSLAVGHNHPKVVARLYDYMKDFGVMHGLGDVYPSRAKVEFFEKLAEFLPAKFTKTALSVTGSQAVELAIKTSILYTKKPGVLCLNQGYHGLDLGAMVLTGLDSFRKPFVGWDVSHNCGYIDSGDNEKTVTEKINLMKRTRNIDVGQIIVEPRLGRYGNKAHPEGWLGMLRSLTRRLGILLIFDEVFTGLGRTGTGFMASEFDCDILCMGKAIGGGMPLSAVSSTDEIMNAWPQSEGEALHTGTFFGHPLSCVAGASTLEIVKAEGLTERSRHLGDKARDYLEDALKADQNVAQIRGKGLMIAVELARPGLGVELMRKLLERRVIIIPAGPGGKAVSITPALNIPEEQLFSALDQLIASVKML